MNIDKTSTIKIYTQRIKEYTRILNSIVSAMQGSKSVYLDFNKQCLYYFNHFVTVKVPIQIENENQLELSNLYISDMPVFLSLASTGDFLWYDIKNSTFITENEQYSVRLSLLSHDIDEEELEYDATEWNKLEINFTEDLQFLIKNALGVVADTLSENNKGVVFTKNNILAIANSYGFVCEDKKNINQDIDITYSNISILLSLLQDIHLPSEEFDLLHNIIGRIVSFAYVKKDESEYVIFRNMQEVTMPGDVLGEQFQEKLQFEHSLTLNVEELVTATAFITKFARSDSPALFTHIDFKCNTEDLTVNVSIGSDKGCGASTELREVDFNDSDYFTNFLFSVKLSIFQRCIKLFQGHPQIRFHINKESPIIKVTSGIENDTLYAIFARSLESGK